ncbi:MAG TPA: ABC transporter ATP-binding protein [bacterium]|nr:ABC transporter ATP-binding protein [bacterium]
MLRVEGLTVEFGGDGAARAGALRAADGVSFEVAPGQAVGIVGESGSGKSVTALSILRLLDERRARISGTVHFEGRDVLALSRDDLRTLRGGAIGIVFQDPAAALDPSWRVGAQLAEAIRAHEPVPAAEARRRAIEALRQVGIPAPEERVDAWPHQLSGGMKQRVMIAIALAARPRLLIADEPTTALDVTVQAQILALLKHLQRERGLSLLLISHDLGLIGEAADEIVVMYAARVVERGPAAQVLARPAHPYTAGLLASTPLPGARRERLREIPGTVPDLRALPPGCRFADRCPAVEARCRAAEPALRTLGGSRASRCVLDPKEVAA